MQGVTRGLQGVTGGYKGVTGGYEGFRRGYKGFEGITRGYRCLERVRGFKRGILFFFYNKGRRKFKLMTKTNSRNV